jgi:hypothetical protein
MGWTIALDGLSLPSYSPNLTMHLPSELDLHRLPLRSIITVGWRAVARAAVHRGEYLPESLEVARAFCLGSLTVVQAVEILKGIDNDGKQSSTSKDLLAADGIQMAALFWASHPEAPDRSTLSVVQSALFMARAATERDRVVARDAEREMKRDVMFLLAEKQRPFPFLGSTIDPSADGPLGSLWLAYEPS